MTDRPAAEAEGGQTYWPFADIAVPLPAPRAKGPEPVTGHPARDATFTYSIPPALRPLVAPGQIVVVPFGRRRVSGIVVALRAESPVAQTRDILTIADERPAIPADGLAVARWMNACYLAPFFACLQAMLPPGLIEAETGPSGRAVRPRRERFARYVVDDDREIEARLQALASAPPAGGRPRRLEAHRAALVYLAAAGGAARVRQITDATTASRRTLAELETAGLVVLGDESVWRDPLAGRQFPRQVAPTLTDDQALAWARLEVILGPISRSSMDLPNHRPPKPAVVLLHGVTGSGKTELYLRSIERVLAQGRQALVLVPEIALTPQTVDRFARRFPERIGVWHSELSAGERVDTWYRAREGALDVIIGSRSAVFAPVPRLGLIVIDEEHAESYKQASTPRYHARDTAIHRADLTGAVVILGSATPSVESYWQGRRGTYILLELPRRIATPAPVSRQSDGSSSESMAVTTAEDIQPPDGAPGRGDGSASATAVAWSDLPPVDVVDMRAELKAGNASIFSRRLQTALASVLNAGEQAILFLNRRGSATFVLCRDCGHVQRCPRCRLPLTYHGVGHDLECHHCRHREPPPVMCPHCASPRIRYFGAGTQRVEAVTRELFPTARLLRWDADTTSRKGAHEALLAQFASGQADVLIGTQMIAKGLDLPRVTLVGVVSADTALYLPDFRSAERTFQLLTQVAGRAGRSALGGRVIFQTYRPDVPAIQHAAAHDFAGFYEREIAFRQEAGYPPWRRLVRLEYQTASGDRTAFKVTTAMAAFLRRRIALLGLAETEIVGPAPAFFGRVRDRVRWQIVVKAADPHALLADLTFSSGWRLDVDPVELL
jgi:primosomal protein N' (replication factor Y) (superfamily II helicase)